MAQHISAIDKAIDAVKTSEVGFAPDGTKTHTYTVSDNNIPKLKEAAKKLARDPEILSAEFKVVQADKQEQSFVPNLISQYKGNLALKDGQKPEFKVNSDLTVTMSANERTVTLSDKEAATYRSIEECRGPSMHAVLDLAALKAKKLMDMGYSRKDDTGRKVLSEDGEFILSVHERAKNNVDKPKHEKSPTQESDKLRGEKSPLQQASPLEFKSVDPSSLPPGFAHAKAQASAIRIG